MGHSGGDKKCQIITRSQDDLEPQRDCPPDLIRAHDADRTGLWQGRDQRKDAARVERVTALTSAAV